MLAHASNPSDLIAPAQPLPADHVIGRRIAVGFGLVAAVAVIMCSMLLSTILSAANLVSEMRNDEHAIDQSHMLSTAVREQYAHQAHTIIEETRSHLDHYRAWVVRVQEIVTALRPIVPASERQRLDAVLRDSRELDSMFRDRILPAVERQDRAALVRLHHQTDELSTRAAAEADAIARQVDARMVHAHVSAMHSTQLGLVGGGICLAVVLALAIGYTLHLRKAVLKPLAALADSARRFGRGDYSVRVGACGEGELRALGEAFDFMVAEIEARERRMMQAERMAVVGQLAAGVAHEINNPIGIIRGYLKTMSPSSNPETLQEEIRILDEEAAACQRIAEDLLEYATGSQVRTVPVVMRDFLNEAVRRFDDANSGSACRIVVNAQPALAQVDPGRARQVLFNLLRNAVRVSSKGAPIEVVGTAQSDGSYEIAVSDRGPGVAPEDRAAIFEPFFSRTTGGSGLGLAVCDSIVRAHGGSIAVEEGPCGGARFRVRFPGAAAASP